MIPSARKRGEPFRLVSEFVPCGDQPDAIENLCKGLNKGLKDQVLLGVTGSGKTYTMAQVIAETGRPALVIAPNKTLAAQLYTEFKQFFPNNAVEYFVSYYDYYQPEAYIPTTDTYIQKDSSINDMIDKMRHSATRSVLSRRDVVVVASVSCIFGLGAPEDYLEMRLDLAVDMEISRTRLLYNLVSMHYRRNDIDFSRGTFRVRGDRIEIFPSYEDQAAIRIDLFGDQIEALSLIDPLKGVCLESKAMITLFPASHYVTSQSTRKKAIEAILRELKERVDFFREQGKHLEAQRIEERTMFDLEMMQELGYCSGIENYSRHLTGRKEGQPPPTLLDYFADDYVMFVDESHITIPQLRAMYRGDRSRKMTLVEYGFRLPSALDNRPLRFDEWRNRVHQVIYVSATPSDWEIQKAAGAVVEQIVRPTGLVDPRVEVRPAQSQVDDLYTEIIDCRSKGNRVLITTLTKRMAEDLTEYYSDLGIAVRYLHSDISTLERMDIIRDLRKGAFDVLVGINLLREGLDIPEVALVAIMDADKEGFLRSFRSLIQTFGRAARNVDGKVILYADRVTGAMRQAMKETNRRRSIQIQFNQRNRIVPKTIEKNITAVFDQAYGQKNSQVREELEKYEDHGADLTLEQRIEHLEKLMQKAARDLEFEKAAAYRDRIAVLRQRLLFEA